VFAESANFALFDFWREDGTVDENVFAWSNRAGDHSALVVYHNPRRKKTYGPDAAGIVGMALKAWDWTQVRFDEDVIRGEWAEKVRNGLAERIDVEMG